MLKLLIDYIRDGTATEIHGDITGCDNLHKTSDFFTKHGFSVSKEMTSYGKHTMIAIVLSAPRYSEFHQLHTVEQQVGRRWIPV